MKNTTDSQPAPHREGNDQKAIGKKIIIRKEDPQLRDRPKILDTGSNELNRLFIISKSVF